jgi:hypothetical protein
VIEAGIIDDTGFPKKGRHSVGVARQYCGQPVAGQSCGELADCLAPVYLPLGVDGRYLATLSGRHPRDGRVPQIALEQIRAAGVAICRAASR